MKWIPPFTAIGLTLATLGVAVAAAQAASLPIGKNGDVEFTTTVTVGTTVLQPAHYRFTHTMQDGQHYIADQSPTNGDVRTGGSRNEYA